MNPEPLPLRGCCCWRRGRTAGRSPRAPAARCAALRGSLARSRGCSVWMETTAGVTCSAIDVERLLAFRERLHFAGVGFGAVAVLAARSRTASGRSRTRTTRPPTNATAAAQAEASARECTRHGVVRWMMGARCCTTAVGAQVSRSRRPTLTLRPSQVRHTPGVGSCQRIASLLLVLVDDLVVRLDDVVLLAGCSRPAGATSPPRLRARSAAGAGAAAPRRPRRLRLLAA